MTYSRSNPPLLQSQSVGGGRQWIYHSTDPFSVVNDAGYFSDAALIGMRVGDTIEVRDTVTPATFLTSVRALTAAGAADLGDGTQITGSVMIGGVALNAARSGVFSGLMVSDGDDFIAQPTRFSLRSQRDGYSSSPIHIGFRRTSVTDSSMYIDPEYRGDRSQNGVPLNFDRVSVGNSVATLTASVPTAEELPFLPATYTGGIGDGDNKPRILAGALRTGTRTMFAADGDWAYEAKIQIEAGTARGSWESFWSTTQLWPDFGEVDLMEIIRNPNPVKQTNMHGSATDGGGNVLLNVNSVTLPTSRFVWMAVIKRADTITFYDDVAVEGVLAQRAQVTDVARISRLRGGHDIRMDYAVSNNWDTTTFNAADWPKTFKFDWWRLSTPVAAGPRLPITWLTPISTTPGGTWNATLPSKTSLFGSVPDREECYGAFDSFDNPGMPTRNAQKRPGGMSVDLTTRAVTGTVPLTEGGRVGICMIGTWSAGGPARIAIQTFNVAPAAQASLFIDQAIPISTALNLTIAYVDFHSGNLGPHTYTVSTDKLWPIIAGNGTGSVTITGTTPGTTESMTVTINCTNAIGQTTTIQRIINVSAFVGDEAFINTWSALKAFYDPNDNATVFSDAAGTTPAVAGSTSVGMLRDKIGVAHLLASTALPTYVTDSIVATRKALKFTRASNQRIFTTNATFLNSVANGNDIPHVIVAAVRRGTAGVSVTPFSFGQTVSGVNNQVRYFVGSGNTVGATRTIGGGPTTVASAGAAMASDAWYIMTIVFTGTALSVRVNGVTDPTAATLNTASLALDMFALGGLLNGATGVWDTASAFDGEIGAVFVAAQGAVDSNTAAAEAYLAGKFGITLP